MDRLERYYEEKLWAWLPEVHRLPSPAGELGDDDAPEAMRALIRGIAASAARMRRRIDRTWEDQAIETCDDALVPRFAELVGTRALGSLDARARRVDVATTIFARRRRGTLPILEATVRSLADVDVALVEAFRTLARALHGLDDPPAPGPWSGTPRGGLAELRRPFGAALLARASTAPFSDFAFTPDLRAPRGADGWHALPTLRLHVYPLRTYGIEDADPAQLGDAGVITYTFDPSGRDVPLFTRPDLATRPARQVRRRGETPEGIETWSPAAPWEVAMPLTCRVLSHVEHVITRAIVLELAALPSGIAPSPTERDALLAWVDVPFFDEATLARRLAESGVVAPASSTEPPWYRALLARTLRPRTGKAACLPAAVAVRVDQGAGEIDVPRERTSGADLTDRTRHPRSFDGGLALFVDPERGRFAFVPEEAREARVRYRVASPMRLGALPIARGVTEPANASGGGAIGLPASGSLVLGDSRTYDLTLDGPREDVAIRSVDGARPYVRLAGALSAEPSDARRLTIEGVWLGGGPLVIERAPDAREGVFDFDEIVVRDATLDPGGVRADGAVLPAVTLVLRARVRSLVIERSIVAGIVVDGGALGALRVRDSIVDGLPADGRALELGDADADLARTTVLGDVRLGGIEASDVVLFGDVRVVDTTNGCFRYSAAHDGARLPRRFESWPEHGSGARVDAGFFRSLRFGDADYARIAAGAPVALREGAETGGERGVFSRLAWAARRRGVHAKLDELAQVAVRTAIFET